VIEPADAPTRDLERAPADQEHRQAGEPGCEVWQLLGRADVIVRGVLEAQDRGERRLWEERARVWLQDVDRAWLDTGRRRW
jgi:hypothetical protein